MQTFVGYIEKYDPKTGKLEKKWSECVADNRYDASLKMNVPMKTVCLEH